MCAALFGRYLTFTGAVRQLRTVPGYALPFDLCLAVAHCCQVLRSLEPEPVASSSAERSAAAAPWPAADAQLALQLLDLAQAAPLGIRDGRFAFAADAVRRRSAGLCWRLAVHLQRDLARSGGLPSPERFQAAGEPGCDPGAPSRAGGHVSAGEDVELPLAAGASGQPEAARVVLVEGEWALVRGEGAGAYARVRAALLPAARSRADGSERHYAALGLPATARPKEVVSAFRRLAKRHHPDKGGDEVAFRRVREAFEALSLAAAAPPAPPPPAAGRRPRTRRAEAMAASIEATGATATAAHGRHGGAGTAADRAAGHSGGAAFWEPGRPTLGRGKDSPQPPLVAVRSWPVPPHKEPACSGETGTRRRLRPLRTLLESPVPSTPMSTVRRRLRSKTSPNSVAGSPFGAVHPAAVSSTSGAAAGRPPPPPPAKRSCRRNSSGPPRPRAGAAAELGAGGAPGAASAARHQKELTVNGLLQLIWAFAFR